LGKSATTIHGNHRKLKLKRFSLKINTLTPSYLWLRILNMKQEVQEAKLELIEWVMRQEKAEQLSPLLEVIRNADHHARDKSKIVGYRAKGQQVTKEMLINSVELALVQIMDGEVIALTDIEKESEQW
jgi:hypothetical protein